MLNSRAPLSPQPPASRDSASSTACPPRRTARKAGRGDSAWAVCRLRVCASRRELETKFPKGARVAEIGDVPRQLRPPHSLSLRARGALRHRSRAQLDPEVAEDPRVRVHYCTSHIVLSGFPDAHFDWIYVDADHSYEGVLRDANAAATKVKPGGFLVFNDFAHADPFLGTYGVQPAVADFGQSLADCLARL